MLSDGTAAEEILSFDDTLGRELRGRRTFNGGTYSLVGFYTGDRVSLASAAEDIERPNAVTLFLHVFDTDELRGREVFKIAGEVVTSDVIFRRRSTDGRVR